MTALVIIRTPFQAWLVEKVLETEKINTFDILYFTQNDSAEDKYYYNKLSAKSIKSEYFFVCSQRFSIFSDVLFKIKSKSWYREKNYDILFCASIDALFISSLVRAFPSSKLITFDDGTGNINTNSCYYLQSNSKRLIVYRFLMKSLSLEKLKTRISKHYSLYKGYENIVNQDRLIYLDGWVEKASRDRSKSKVYFLGSPFEEDLNQEQIYRLEEYAKSIKIDAYIAHPRERNILDVGAEILNKNGRIAEEAIIADAKDASIVLVGTFSTVMLNIGTLCKSRIVLLPQECLRTPELFELSKKAGCTPILI